MIPSGKGIWILLWILISNIKIHIFTAGYFCSLYCSFIFGMFYRIAPLKCELNHSIANIAWHSTDGTSIWFSRTSKYEFVQTFPITNEIIEFPSIHRLNWTEKKIRQNYFQINKKSQTYFIQHCDQIMSDKPLWWHWFFFQLQYSVVTLIWLDAAILSQTISEEM